MKPLVAFLQDLGATKATGAHTAETSFYPALKALLDKVGNDLTPRVRCVMNLRNQGAGLPDGGLFTQDQFGHRVPADLEAALAESKPSRGALEVKPPRDDLKAIAASNQVSRYGAAYGHILITNLREFALLKTEDGKSSVLEEYTLAESEAALWDMTVHPMAASKRHEAHFCEFLERVLRIPAPLASPEDVAWFLASYARDALSEIENSQEEALLDIRTHLESALGISFGGEKGQHFFNSTLVQTLFYGLFSAWVLWCRQDPRPNERFSRKDTAELLHLPVLKVLFHEITRPTAYFTKFIRQALDLAESTLNRVDRTAFFQRFREHEAVQYFYEPFLEAFDPRLRKELGVWYTPEEVVRYMVERIDRALRDQLGLADGLADRGVQVLDPCCGTGAFLVAVLDRIHRTLRDQDGESIAPAEVAKAATERVLGFEILPAPFVVAHLQVGLYLHELGASLPAGTRAAIYLTNALTGWSEAGVKQLKILPELAEERDAADKVKQKAKILVVLGNPPYNAFAGVQPTEEEESVDAYKEGLSAKWSIRKFNLDDLYVRFLRLGERKIAEQTKRGIVCFISNASYAADASFVVLRERFLRQFDTIAIDNLNGDSRETGKLTPDGKPDPSVFSTERNREGIRVGTAVGLFCLTGRKRGDSRAEVRWRDFWGAGKRADLLGSLEEGSDGYTRVSPSAETRWSFKPLSGNADYLAWPRVVDLCQYEPISGLAEKRKGGLLALTREALAARMSAYFNGAQSWESVAPVILGLADDAGRYPAKMTREKLLASPERFAEERLRRYALLPFDTRWCYHTNSRPLWNEPRPDLVAQAWEGNRFFVTRMNAERPGEQCVAMMTSALPDHHLLRPNIIAIPLRARLVILGEARTTANLSARARAYLKGLGIADPDGSETAATLLWYHALAITYSPAWQAENGPAIRADFPRVPLPGERAALERSAALGRTVADLLDPDRGVPGVTVGTIRPELRLLGNLRRVDRRPIDPAAGDLGIEARWGMLQQGSVVMPGPGRITDAAEANLLKHPLGSAAYDVWLNDRVSWHAVPKSAWEFRIGGYQVLKKWLSYRERTVLGRDLTLDEARELTDTIRRIAALLLLSGELDRVYQAVRGEAAAWTK